MTIPTPQTPDDERKFANGLDEDGNLTFERVGIEDLFYKGRYGALGYSGTSNDISIGTKYFVLDVDNGKFRVGDDILITSLDDQDCFMWGEIVGKDTVWEPVRLLVYIDDISDVTNTSINWELQVVARPKPGIEKDTSTTSVNPTTGGPWTFTVTSGKFFPIGGTLLIKPTTDRTIALIGEVSAYSSTSLTVTLRATNATVSQAYTSWSIALLDSPPAEMPLLSIIGLVTDAETTANTIVVSAGSVMDSTGTVLLTLDSEITKLSNAAFATGTGNGSAARTLLTGTISTSGTAVSGTGTVFTTELSTTGALADYLNSGGASPNIAGTFSVLGGNTWQLSSITNNTSASALNIIAATNAAYYRGGFTGSSNYGIYYVALIRRDSDGLVDVATCTSTPSGEPDLPAGFTYYRIIALFSVENGTSYGTELHIHAQQPYAAKGSYFATWTADANLPNSKYLSSSTSVTANSVSSSEMQFRRAALTGDVTAPANSNATTIANDAVTNAKLNDMAAYTLKGRNAGTTGDPSDIDISALTEKVTLVDADLFLIQDSAASNAFKKVQKSNISSAAFPPGTFDLFLAASL